MARLDVEAVYRNYGHSVLRRARQIMANEDDAMEMMQEIFANLVARPDQFDGTSTPSTFLYAVTTNACLQKLRDRRNRSRLVDQEVKPWTSEVDPRSPATVAIVRSALAQLPADEAQASVYYHLDGMTHAEIAEVMACSRRHVGDLLERVGQRFHREAS